MFVCDRCGGTEVQILDWIDPNTGEVVGGNDVPASGDTWCERCDRPAQLVCVGDDGEPQER